MHTPRRHRSPRKPIETLYALQTVAADLGHGARRLGRVAGARAAELMRLAQTRAGNATEGERQVAAGMVVAAVVTMGVLSGAVALANPGAAAFQASPVAVVLSEPAAPAPAKPAAKRPAAGKAGPAPKWNVPMSAQLSSCYGPRWGAMHLGIDFAGDDGTRIRAVGAGTVFGAGWLYAGYGMSVVIDHGDGYFSHYAHASRLLVREGQKVKPGQVIATEGTTGDSTGPHLHFEIHRGLWNQVDPALWLRAHGVKIDC